MAAGLPSNNHDPAFQKIADPRSARYSDLPFFANGGRDRVGTIRPGSTISNDLGQSCLHNMTQRVSPEGDHELALQ
jgi:hypothetical protein